MAARKGTGKKPRKEKRPPRSRTVQKAAPPSKDSPREKPGRDLIGMAEAVEILKTTQPTFYRWLRTGKIKGMKVGRQWRFYREDIERFLEGREPRISLPTDIGPLIVRLRDLLKSAGVDVAMPEGTHAAREAVTLMILLGRTENASDLHISSHLQPGESEPETVLRCRIDGVLYEKAKIDTRLLPAIVEEWRDLAACNPAERSKPQDGRIMLDVSEYTGAPKKDVLDLRVNFLPATLGESVTARLLSGVSFSFGLDRLPFAQADRERLLRGIRNPWGVVLCTGPSGSGKTTTMYASFIELARPGLKILAVEEPVEFTLPWATQVAVNVARGVTFETALRAFMRCDPDVMMIGEIRTPEVLEGVQRAAITGHLVFSQLHAPRAADALLRMVDVGADPFMVAESTKLIIAQRLLRRLCRHCNVEDAPSPTRLDMAADAARRGGLPWESLDRGFRKAVGCPKCSQTGYSGRTLAAEVMEVTPEIGHALRRGASAEEITTIAVGQGMTTLAADGVRRAAAGETSLDEVMRVLG